MRLAIPLFLMLVLAGCNRSASTLAPVSGQVFYRGKPVEKGTIVFTPDPERGGRGPQAWAEIGPEGRYNLHTDGRAGAIPGWHRITVSTGGVVERPLPNRYSDPDLSRQRFEVKPDRSNRHDLHLD